VGTLYNRIVQEARGWEQIPNWEYWQAIGQYSSNFCGYVLRCGKRKNDSYSAYENLNNSNNNHASDDENLLNNDDNLLNI